jgi:hypothetical protein
MVEAEAPHGDPEHDEHGYKIVVDTAQHTVEHEEVSWQQVVNIAYPGQADDPLYVFKVQYEDAKSRPTSGTLVKGHHVEVERTGTNFSVLRSVVS